MSVCNSQALLTLNYTSNITFKSKTDSVVMGGVIHIVHHTLRQNRICV